MYTIYSNQLKLLHTSTSTCTCTSYMYMYMYMNILYVHSM